MVIQCILKSKTQDFWCLNRLNTTNLLLGPSLIVDQILGLNLSLALTNQKFLSIWSNALCYQTFHFREPFWQVLLTHSNRFGDGVVESAYFCRRLLLRVSGARNRRRAPEGQWWHFAKVSKKGGERGKVVSIVSKFQATFCKMGDKF